MEQVNPLETLEQEISHNYQQLKREPQDRHPHDHSERSKRGQLISPAGQIFESRMNRLLDEWSELNMFIGKAAILGETEEREAA